MDENLINLTGERVVIDTAYDDVIYELDANLPAAEAQSGGWSIAEGCNYIEVWYEEYKLLNIPAPKDNNLYVVSHEVWVANKTLPPKKQRNDLVKVISVKNGRGGAYRGSVKPA